MMCRESGLRVRFDLTKDFIMKLGIQGKAVLVTIVDRGLGEGVYFILRGFEHGA